VALYLAQVDGVSRADYGVDTDAGLRDCKVEREGDTAEVTIDMGAAEARGTISLDFEGRHYEFLRVSTGNPHAITFDSELDAQAIDRFAPLVSATTPGGLNVEFAHQKGPNELDVIVWERGVGRTLACGTGAVATAVAASLVGRTQFGSVLRVVLPGGPLAVNVKEAGLFGQLRGPAREVFRGHLL
jgi:diaminopimelate epimerase